MCHTGNCSLNLHSNLAPSLAQVKHRIVVLNLFVSRPQLSDTCRSKVIELWHQEIEQRSEIHNGSCEQVLVLGTDRLFSVPGHGLLAGSLKSVVWTDLIMWSYLCHASLFSSEFTIIYVAKYIHVFNFSYTGAQSNNYVCKNLWNLCSML